MIAKQVAFFLSEKQKKKKKNPKCADVIVELQVPYSPGCPHRRLPRLSSGLIVVICGLQCRDFSAFPSTLLTLPWLWFHCYLFPLVLMKKKRSHTFMSEMSQKCGTRELRGKMCSNMLKWDSGDGSVGFLTADEGTEYQCTYVNKEEAAFRNGNKARGGWTLLQTDTMIGGAGYSCEASMQRDETMVTLVPNWIFKSDDLKTRRSRDKWTRIGSRLFTSLQLC